jgi:hypothetical protein
MLLQVHSDSTPIIFPRMTGGICKGSWVARFWSISWGILTYKPFFFTDFSLFFRTRTTFFRTRETSAFFQIDLFYSSLFYGEYTPSDRSFQVGSTPKSPTQPKNGFVLCPQARRWPRDGPAETATNFRSHNNNFQSH